MIQGPLALTELHLKFRNPHQRVIEGRFEVTLPAGATVSRFAMRLPTGWQEAEVVERQKARRVYEDFLHRKQDPALLEKDAGNRFRARVFPIPPRGEKEIIVGYSEELVTRSSPYRLYLQGLPAVGQLDIAVWEGGQRHGFRDYDSAPESDFVVQPRAGLDGLRHQNLAVVRITPTVRPTPEPLADLLVLVDTSASRALGLTDQVDRLGAVLERLRIAHGDALELTLACFDQQIAKIYRGPIGRLRDDHLKQIAERAAMGASDFGRALRWAAKQEHSRVLLVTDGIATAGPTEAHVLADAVRKLAPATRRLDALVVGGIRDQKLLRALVAGNLPGDGVVLDLDRQVEELAARLGESTLSKIDVSVAGARWVWPRRLQGVQSGDQVLVYADVPAEPDSPNPRALVVRLSGDVRRDQTVRVAAANKPLLERAWIKARIERLEHLQQAVVGGDPELAQMYRSRIVELSSRYRVLTDLTALLVLESERDYRRYGIGRRALADILTVTPKGPALLQRKAPVFGSGRGGVLAWLRADEGTIGAGRGSATAMAERTGPGPKQSLGGREEPTTGRVFGFRGLGRRRPGSAAASAPPAVSPDALGTIFGGGGGGRASGTAAFRGARSAPSGHAARVLSGRAEVRGALDKQIIGRIVRRHLSELRYCYALALARHPGRHGLHGRIVLQFTIASSGHVVVSKVKSSTVGSREFEACVVRAPRRWLFPKPAGRGIVHVTYPFIFRAGANRRAATGPGGETPERSAVSPARGRRKPLSPSPRFAAHTGRFAEISRLLAAGKSKAALVAALRWRDAKPGDVLAFVALGRVLEHQGEAGKAARAYGSIIELFPSRADMRRYAGNRLEALGTVGLPLAVDSYRKAVSQRPDHPTGARLLAYALARQGRFAEASAALRSSLDRRYPPDRFDGIKRILREDLALVSAAWLAKDPSKRAELRSQADRYQLKLPRRPSLRFVLTWETDANDVDLHVRDRRGGHADYRNKRLDSGGALYADVANGYGPECFAIDGRPRAFPYRILVHYYSRGPMGYGMGTVQMVRHDGLGTLQFDYRPFVVMKDDAYLDLGLVQRARKSRQAGRGRIRLPR